MRISPSRTPPPPARAILLKALLVVGSVTLAGILAEGILRVAGLSPPTSAHLLPPHAVQRDRQTEWDLVYEVNSLGLRDEEHPYRREAGAEMRIVVVGDSFTFGQGVARRETFPEVLEETLSTAGTKAEVINVSCIGVGAESYFVLVRDVALRFDPDVVVLNVFGNDASAVGRMGPLRRTLRVACDSSNLLTLGRVFRQRLAARSAVVAVRSDDLFWSHLTKACANTQPPERCEQLSRAFRDRYGSAPNNLAACSLVDPGDVRRWTYTETQSGGWEDFEDHVARIAGLCRGRGVRLVVGIVPDGVQVDPAQLALRRSLGVNYPDSVLLEEGPFQRAVRELCRRLSLPCYDPTESFRASPEGLYFPADLHWTKEGHRRYGLGLASFLASEAGAAPPPS
jgi:lysophospholipase L1-like esterase